MDLKKEVLLILILTILLLFSGCNSLIGSSQTGSDIKIDNTGIGLEVDFNIDDSRIENRILDVDLTLKNSGKEAVILKKDQNSFSIRTQTSNKNGESLFDKSSIDKYLNVIFKGKDTITLYQNQEIIIPSFPLLLDSKEFLTMPENEIILLNIKYNYKTEFSNNVNVDLSSKNLLKVTDSISQAAPVQLDDIELKMVDLDKYEIGFSIIDKGPYFSTNQRFVYLDNINLGFSDYNINFNSCTLWEKRNTGFQKATINSKVTLSSLISEILITCPVDLSRNSKEFSTEVKGSFEYIYSLTFEEKINLPNNREYNDVWS